MNPQEARSSPGPDAGLASGADCWTPKRLELRDWLSRNASSLAELYEGAVRLLFEHRLAGYTRFVGHAVREIGNRLPEAISGSTSATQLSYKNRLDVILEQWKRAGLGTDGTLSLVPAVPGAAESRPEEVVLPLHLAQSIVELIADHEATREKPSDRAIKLFIGTQPENEQFLDTIRPTVTQWLEVTGWFMKITHDNGRGDAGVNHAELHEKFDLFEFTLGALVQKFFTTTDELDELLVQANSRTDQ